MEQSLGARKNETGSSIRSTVCEYPAGAAENRPAGADTSRAAPVAVAFRCSRGPVCLAASQV
jgi:hypothetical protein